MKKLYRVVERQNNNNRYCHYQIQYLSKTFFTRKPIWVDCYDGARPSLRDAVTQIECWEDGPQPDVVVWPTE